MIFYFFFLISLFVLSSQLHVKHIKGHAIGIITFNTTGYLTLDIALYALHKSSQLIFMIASYSNFHYFPILLEEKNKKQGLKLVQDHTQRSSRAGIWT